MAFVQPGDLGEITALGGWSQLVDATIVHGLALRRGKEEHQMSHLGSYRLGSQDNFWL